MSKNENTNIRKVGHIIFNNIHKNTDENTISKIINQKITNLIRNDLSKGAVLC